MKIKCNYRFCNLYFHAICSYLEGDFIKIEENENEDLKVYIFCKFHCNALERNCEK